jgi:hypothetical protein
LDQAWVRDITGATTVQVIVQYIRVWDLLLDFTLIEAADRFIWKWTASDEFSSALAYRVLFFGRSLSSGHRMEDSGTCQGALLRVARLAWSLLDV